MAKYWGTRHFESRDAVDWLFYYQDNQSIKEITTTFKEAFEQEDRGIDKDVGSKVLAAGELIAAAKGKESRDFDQLGDEFQDIDLKDIEQHADEDVVQMAKKAIDMVSSGEKSALRQHWEGSEDYDQWLEHVEELKKRISD